ncbi:MAG: aminotransferase class V-fold PLP-dependent enzyme [Herbiconiux sp.]|uniref:aminotransferase class V-fold PLP-dependent enzyme n=1 Tax=Herbiconiux sp. TaxID=1871186 RepID=UPI0011FB6882|nr:aminotransferase class V-fold PLP-dependent enzyme [Herbiconiux sp.]TAJ48078.1 MAG: aminotransferase class V-fold PLP-dependent enzyme [Herbiconiux sp.]
MTTVSDRERTDVHPEQPIDVAAERARTPGSTTRHHFNSAGAALQTRETVDSVVQHLRLEEAEGGYEAAKRNSVLTERAYTSAAALLGAEPREIALFDSATTAMTRIIDSLRIRPGQKIVVSRSTYVSQALQLLTLRDEQHIGLVIIDNDDDGVIDLVALERELDGSTDAVVCIAHIPTSSGAIEPVHRVGEIAAAHGALYLLDATQSVGQIEVDVTAIGCDVLVTTGRKFLRGPRGTGIAYVSSRLLERLVPASPDVRASSWVSEGEWVVERSARMLESWEHSVAARVGLGVALGQALERGMGPTAVYLGTLAGELRARLSDLPGVEVTDPPKARSAIVTFRLAGIADTVVCEYLKERNIHTISIPAAHAQWDLGARGLGSVVRASVHVYNDRGDIDALVLAVAELAATAVESAGVER